ncbi:hypothetical protein F8388_009489 [Cannabis sativa]|uniref:Uncharacterized protein n=1 Tax=Cannabis sativa TaxID=3483 RepID=A0A7J6EIP1_CANSA|nr:hypothetical protein F8388_009489 [Cannabis sativa]KAF4387106.1 hypothetical protein G4B88_024678 [Cannabis sativa]
MAPVGIEPVKLLKEKSMNRTNETIVENREFLQVTKIRNINRMVRFLRLHKEVGMGPVSWLLERSNNLPISDGIEPVKLLVKTDNTSKLLNFEMLTGSVPDSWLIFDSTNRRRNPPTKEVFIQFKNLKIMCLSLESFEILDDKCPTNLLFVRLKDSSLIRLENTDCGIDPFQLFSDKSRKVKFLHFDMKPGNVELK